MSTSHLPTIVHHQVDRAYYDYKTSWGFRVKKFECIVWGLGCWWNPSSSKRTAHSSPAPLMVQRSFYN
jgi:hypothetical protein